MKGVPNIKGECKGKTMCLFQQPQFSLSDYATYINYFLENSNTIKFSMFCCAIQEYNTHPMYCTPLCILRKTYKVSFLEHTVVRNYIFSLIWRCYGLKRDIMDYWGTIIYYLLSYYILSKDKGL